MKTTQRKPKADAFSPRIRFNWGFWDGYQDATRGRDRGEIAQGRPFCLNASEEAKPYTDGYRAGQAFYKDGWTGNSSNEAWNAYTKTAGTAPAAA